MARVPKNILVDFDGVIHDYDGNWKGTTHIPGDAIEGAIFWLDSLAKEPDLQVHVYNHRPHRGNQHFPQGALDHQDVLGPGGHNVLHPSQVSPVPFHHLQPHQLNCLSPLSFKLSTVHLLFIPFGAFFRR